jgi:hypothetical protein
MVRLPIDYWRKQMQLHASFIVANLAFVKGHQHMVVSAWL